MHTPISDIEAPLAREETPLVGDIEQRWEAQQLKPIKAGSMREILVALLGAITFLASAIAIIINQSMLVVLSGLFGVAFSPYAAFQQQKITQAVAMRETNEYFQKQLNTLHYNNNNLSCQVKDMTQSADKLKEMEKTLGIVQAMRGNCLKQLEQQLVKQRKISSMTSTNVRDDIVGNLFEIAFNCDDGDGVLSDEEIGILVKKIESINGVDIREVMVKEMIDSHGRDLISLMEVAKNALRDDIPADKRLFVYIQ